MNKKSLPWIITAALVVVLGTGGVWYYKAKTAATPTNNFITGQVKYGNISKKVNATGTVQLPDQFNLSFGSKTKVTQINVQVGDTVKAGQILAQLDTKDINQQIVQSKAALSISQEKLIQLQQGPTQAQLASAQDAITKANSSLYNAQVNLQNLKNNPDANSVALQQATNALNSAQASYNAAKAQLDQQNAGPNSADLQAAQAQVSSASAAWSQAQTAASAATTNQSLQVAAQQAYSNYLSALSRLSDLQNPPTTAILQAQSGLQQAAASLYNAQVSLNNVKNNPNANDQAIQQATNSLNGAQADYNSAKAQLDELNAGPASTDLLTAQDQVAQNQASLTTVEDSLNDAEIVAPVDGIVTAVNGQLGEYPASGAFITLMATSSDIQVNVPVDEADIGGVKVGQAVQLNLPAYPDKTFNGSVTQVAPVATTANNVTTFSVTVTAPNTNNLAKPGMSANVAIIVAQKQNVLVVPSEAVQDTGTEQVVMVPPTSGSTRPQRKVVKIGVDDGTNAEVQQGLADGDQVIIGYRAQSSTQQGGSIMGGLGGGRAFGGGGGYRPGGAGGRPGN